MPDHEVVADGCKRHSLFFEGFESKNPALKLLKPPEVLGRFNYLMAWHPRMNTDAAHVWLRRVIRETAKALNSE